MRIGIEQAAPDVTLDEMLDKLRKLPSSFSHYTPYVRRSNTLEIPELPGKAGTYFRQAEEDDNPRSGIKAYKKTLAELEKHKHRNIQHGHVNHRLAIAHQKNGAGDTAIARCKKAMLYYAKDGEYERLRALMQYVLTLPDGNKTLNDICKGQSAIVNDMSEKRGHRDYRQKKEIIARRYLAAIAEATAQEMAAFTHLAELYDLQHGPLDITAVILGEREFAVSDSVPISICPLAECLVITIRARDIAAATIIHFNRDTDPASLEGIVKNFRGAPLEVRLVGAGTMYPQSRDNISNVLSRLRHYENIAIKSADIWDRKYPPAIIYDPARDHLRNGVGIDRNFHRSADSLTVAQSHESAKEPLCQAFVFRDGKVENFSIKPTQGGMDMLQSFDGKTAGQLYEFIRERNPDAKPEQKAIMAAFLIQPIEANISATLALVDYITALAQQRGIPAEPKEAYEKFIYEPKYLGEGSHQLNFDLIGNYMNELTQSKNTRSAHSS